MYWCWHRFREDRFAGPRPYVSESSCNVVVWAKVAVGRRVHFATRRLEVMRLVSVGTVYVELVCHGVRVDISVNRGLIGEVRDARCPGSSQV
eukprot:8949996-Lingulodinium_polyedra.AAC.1